MKIILFFSAHIKGDIDSLPISIEFVKVQEEMEIFINWQTAIIGQARPKSGYKYIN